MVQKVNGFAKPGNFTGKKLNYYTFRTLLDITPTGRMRDITEVNPSGLYPFKVNESDAVAYNNESEYVAAVKAQARFDMVIQTISLRAQPVILGSVYKRQYVKSQVQDLPAVDNVDPWASMASNALIDVYEVTFAIEHNLAWEPQGNQQDLPESMNGIGGDTSAEQFSYINPTHPLNNVALEFLGDTL